MEFPPSPKPSSDSSHRPPTLLLWQWCIESSGFLDTAAVRLALKFFGLLLLSISLVPVHAQESTDQQLVVEPNPTPAAVNEVAPATTAKPTGLVPETPNSAAPDVYLLPDESGTFRKVLGFRYEDFLEAWRRGPAAGSVTPPRYAIDALTFTGKVLETHARLRVEFSVTVQSEKWVDIPIQLPGLIVQEMSLRDRATGECLTFDKQRHGYVVWLSGAVGKQRQIVLEGLTKLKINTASTGIECYLPRTTTSRYVLEVPGLDTQFDPPPELVLTKLDKQDDSTKVYLEGQTSPFRLNWTSTAEAATTSRTALIAVTGQTTVAVDRHHATYEALLTANSLGGPLQQIRVRLPRGAKLTPGQLPSDYEVEQVEASADPDERQVVVIRRADLQAQQSAWKLRLAAKQALDSSTGSAQCSIEGFEVLNAAQQSGALTLEVDDQLQAYFDIHGNLEQIPKKDSSATPEGRSVLGEFRYARFPWQLVVFTLPRQRRVSVKPEYDLFITPEEAQLDVQYKYQLTGAQVFSLRVKLNGWERTDAPIESGGLVDRDGIVETRKRHLVLPLVNPSAQQVLLKISFRKKMQLGKNTFIPPEPKGALVVDGQWIVDSAKALLVTPTLEELVGLSVVTEPSETSAETSSVDSEDLVERLRLSTFLSQPKLVAQVALKQREVSTKVSTQVDVGQQILRVQQQLDYLSKYRPVSQLSLDIPNQMWLNETLTFTLDGEPLPLELSSYLGEEPGDEAPDESAREDTFLRQVVVSLPRPMQNAIRLQVTCELPAPDFSEEAVSVTVPLVAPLQRIRSHTAIVNSASPLQINTKQRSMLEPWVIDTGDKQLVDPTTTLSLKTAESVSSLVFSAQLDSAEDQIPLATLERAWIQTWLTSGARQHRAVFRFRTLHEKVVAQLPAGEDRTEIEVLLDGEPWKYERLENGRLAVDLPANGQLSSHTLELRYQQGGALPTWGKLQMVSPQLECRATSIPVYWQLILPRAWQVTTAPKQLTADYWLGWKNYRWGRQPTLSQADLEQITKAFSSQAPAPLSTQYVYRGFEIPEKMQVVVIRQTWLFVACTLLAFGIGLLWLYTSMAQNGVFWLLLSSTLLAGIFSYPEVTLLAIQAILTGGLMTLAAKILRQTFTVQTPLGPAGSTLQPESSAHITESWQPSGQRSDSVETTATMRTGGPLS